MAAILMPAMLCLYRLALQVIRQYYSDGDHGMGGSGIKYDATFVTEILSDFVYTLKTAYDKSLQVKLGGDTQVEVHIQ